MLDKIKLLLYKSFKGGSMDKTYVRYDDYNEYKNKMKEYGVTTDNCIPVDLNSAQVPTTKDTPIADIEDNIQERFNLENEGGESND